RGLRDDHHRAPQQSGEGFRDHQGAACGSAGRRHATDMSPTGRLEFRIAAADAEFEQIHRLNYRTFVEEIPQHAPSAERRLIDKFHPENTYLIAVLDGTLVGMLAVRDRRPFSLDQKLADLDRYLPAGRKICE